MKTNVRSKHQTPPSWQIKGTHFQQSHVCYRHQTNLSAPNKLTKESQTGCLLTQDGADLAHLQNPLGADGSKDSQLIFNWTRPSFHLTKLPLCYLCTLGL